MDPKANTDEADIILYDLASTRDGITSFSPTVWRVRLLLNYKRIPYSVVRLEFPDIEPRLKELGFEPAPGARTGYTVPAIHHIPSDTKLIDSARIARFLEETYREPDFPSVSIDSTATSRSIQGPAPSAPSGGNNTTTSSVKDKREEIERRARCIIGPIFQTCIMPREVNLLSPRSAQYFRNAREASGSGAALPEGIQTLEDMLAGDREEQVWSRLEDQLDTVGELLRENSSLGPFVLGDRPTWTDFTLVGALEGARAVHEQTALRIIERPGFKQLYEACRPYFRQTA